MRKTSLIFFGSFQHYSVKVLKALHQAPNIDVLCVVTTPPSPRRSRSAGGPNPVQDYAQTHHLPIFTHEKLDKNSLKQLGQLEIRSIRNSSQKPDYFVVAGYGMKLPKAWLDFPTVAPLNLHPSLLPKYRGSNPAEWAILMGETETGVTLIRMDSGLDTGPILAQEKLAIEQPVYPEGIRGDTRETLYAKLYDLGAKMIINFLHSGNGTQILSSNRGSVPGMKLAQPQPKSSPTVYARKLQRVDSFLPWPLLLKAIHGQKISPSDLPPFLKQTYKTIETLSRTRTSLTTSSVKNLTLLLIERAVRALSGFPGVWTEIRVHPRKHQHPSASTHKRMKIISCHLQSLKIGKLENWKIQLDLVQLAGLKPSTFNEINNQILT